MVEFNHYYNKYFSYIRMLVKQIIQDDPDDITQMAFYKLSQCDYIENDGMALGFLKTTARNMSISHLRKKEAELKNIKKMRNELNMYDEPAEEMNLRLDNLADLAEIHADVIQFIHDEIQRLKPREREYFELFCYQNMNAQQIAKRCNVSTQTVRNTLTYARKKMKIEILFYKKDVLQLLAKRPTI